MANQIFWGEEHYYIVPEKCKGCTLCAKVCPVNAITGAVKEAHVIDQDKCIQCGECVSRCKFNAIDILHYHEEGVPFKEYPFVFRQAVISGTILTIRKPSEDAVQLNLEYSFDAETWTPITYATTSSTTIAFDDSPNKTIYLRGENETLSNSVTTASPFSFTNETDLPYVEFGGDITTLLNKTGRVTDISDKPYCFAYLFANLPHLIYYNNPLKIYFPPIKLSPYCYYMMFANSGFGSPNLWLTAPVLEPHCYERMFYNNNGLSAGSVYVVAQQYAEYCCKGMFENSKTTNGATINLGTLAPHCFEEMYKNCTRLNVMTNYYPPNEPDETYFLNWVEGVPAMYEGVQGLFKSKYNPSEWAYGNSGIPTGWLKQQM